ncbi:MAG: hypothetical protein NTV98_02530 [Candidatus Roizmanbacteria bacterium]|nr:hypothetical protein [Candidatus Roizmanbacteria bacterium]
MAKKSNSSMKFLFVNFLILIVIIPLGIYSYGRIVSLEQYKTLVQETYKIPTDKSIEETIPPNYKFLDTSAFGITLSSIPELFNENYAVDPNFRDLFFWTDKTGKPINLSKVQNHVNIGIPLKPEDTKAIDPTKAEYVTTLYSNLQKVFERSGFVKNSTLNHLRVSGGFDNLSDLNFVAYENSVGTKCSIAAPSQDHTNIDSSSLNIGSRLIQHNFVFIYIACISKNEFDQMASTK